MSLTSHRRLMTDGSNIDDEHEKEHEHRHDHNRTAQAKLPFTGYKAQFTLRKSSSANDVQNSIDEIEHNTPDEPEPRLIFGLPRLVLKDKEEPNYAPIPNCGDYIALPSVPLPNIPLPTISLPKIPLPTLPSLALKAKKEPSYDPVMSCSLAPRQSCARSLSKTDTGSCCQLDDKEHQRNATPPCTQKHEDIQKVDIVAVANDIAEDVARLGLLIKEVQNPLRSISHDSGRHSTLETQEESSVASENEEPIASESDTSTRPRKATPSLLHKPQTPSLLSGASRGSSRHSLLKTSVSAAMSVDTGLPIPPVLSPVAVVSSESSESRDVQIKAPRPGNAYWGFNSDAKAAVQDAVQDAVKKTLHEMLIPSGKPPPQEPLETVPLETKEESDNKSQNPGWNVTAPWTKQYEKVPPQEPSQEPEKGPNPKIKTSEKDLATKRGVSTGGDPDEDDHRSISSTASSDLKTGLRKAVPWLKGLVHNRGHEARFTELPPRTLRDSNGHVKAQQTEDTPAIGVSNPDVPNEEPAPDMFAKTIEDLENLLSEAMFIARQAADTESGYIPMLLGNAAAVLKDGRVEMQDDYTVREASKARILTMAYSEKRTACSDGSDAQSMHESLKDYSGPSDDEGEGDNSPEHYQQNVPKIKVKKPTSGISVSTELTCTISPALPPNLAPPPVSDASRTKSTIALHDSIQSGQKIDSEEAGPLDVNPFIVPGATLRKASTYTISPSQTSRVATDLETNPIEKGTINTPKSGSGSLPHTLVTPPGYDFAAVLHQRQSKYDQRIVKNKSKKSRIPNKQDMREDIESLHPPSIEPRLSSLKLKSVAAKGKTHSAPIRASDTHSAPITTTSEGFKVSSCSQSFDGSEVLDFGTGKAQKQKETDPVNMSGGLGSSEEGMAVKDNADYKQPEQSSSRPHMFNLNGKRHVSLKGEHHKGFSLTRSHKKQVVARDWAPARKRFVATVACISTSLIGILTGIYAAEVPAIQYYVVDFHHNIILGNVFFFVGLAISTFFFWPLPLLHGRKPYVLGSMCLAMPLLFPQALTVGEFRSPYEAKWRVALLLSRAVMGFTLGFSNMNFKATLTDLFGASLQSSNPHQEVVDINDVRRHGGGLGVWLGIWTWCTIGSGGIGFLIGAGIINSANPAWGFYISICIIAGVLLLNVICPEVRRSAFRRSVAEVKDGEDQGSRRVARGEVKMHMVQSGPKWWGEEFHYGVKLSLRMLRQPGFLVLALYTAWIYGQIVMIVVLLGSLTSKHYKFKSPCVGASVAAIPVGALLAVPFQKAGLFSRDRTHAPTSDDDTRNKKIGMSSHLIRRTVFALSLPFAGLAYTLSSNGPPIPWILPILFAGLIGFLSNLGLAECHGIIMETFDISDLQPGMTGRPRKSKLDKYASKRTNYSSFPRVSSAFAITQSFGYLIAAAATGVGGVAQRQLGQQTATGVVAGILLILSILLLGVLVRFREIQIIPNMQKEGMETFMAARRKSAYLRGDVVGEDDVRPTIIGNPTHVTRRMCVLEMGSMTRWTEIRNKNHLVDKDSLEAQHPNLAAMRNLEEKIRRKESEIAESIRKMSREDGRRGRRSQQAQMESYEIDEGGDLGGHRGKDSQSKSKPGKAKEGNL